MRSASDPRLHQRIGEPIRPVLGAREDQRLRHRLVAQEVDDQRRLQFLGHRIDGLGDAGCRRRLPLNRDRDGIAQHLAGQRRNRRRHGRAEEQGLATRRQLREDPPDLRQETHVQHPVRLVQHQMLDVPQPRVARAHVIHQPAGRRDDDVDAAAERVFLRPHADAPVDRRSRDRRVDGERVEVVQNLGRQLSGRSQDERLRRPPRPVDQSVNDGQQERGGLAASRLRARHHVAAVERRRNGLALNGGRTNEAELPDGLQE